MMWISEIKLLNFKSYNKAVFRFPQPQQGKNLVLIGAENGHGKTTLLEAIYFCLYDDDAIRYLTRAGLNAEEISYPAFLKQALYHQAEAKHGQYKMALEIDICRQYGQKVETLRVTRIWHFNDRRECLIKQSGGRETRVVLSDNLGKETIVPEEYIEYVLNNCAVPHEYAPFFFFDGEKIVQTAIRNGAGFWLSSALKMLIGVSLLHDLKNSLNKYRAQNISESGSQKIQTEWQRTQADLQEAEAKLSELLEEWKQLDEQKDLWANKRDILVQELGGGSDIKNQQQLMEQRTNLEKEHDQLNNKVKQAVLAMPLSLLPKDRMYRMQQQFEAELKRLNWEEGKNQLHNRVNEFWNAFKNNKKVHEVMGYSAEMILSHEKMWEAMVDCWQQIFDPAPEGYAQVVEHNYLSRSAYENICDEIQQLQNIPNEPMSELLEKISHYEKLVKDLDDQIGLLADEPRRNERVKALQEANQKSSELLEQAAVSRANFDRQKREVQSLKSKIDHLYSQIESNNPKLEKSQRAGAIEKMIDDLSQQLLAAKVQGLSETATRINKSIAHDERISRINIAENGQMNLLGADGNVIRATLSAGQMQVLIMSLASALAEVTGYHAPYVIDTPWARLDEKHRQNLFKHWLNLPQQVILLSQDSEVTSEVYKQFAHHFNKTYLVRAASLKSGGATSVVQENVYF